MVFLPDYLRLVLKTRVYDIQLKPIAIGLVRYSRSEHRVYRRHKWLWNFKLEYKAKYPSAFSNLFILWS